MGYTVSQVANALRTVELASRNTDDPISWFKNPPKDFVEDFPGQLWLLHAVALERAETQ